MKSWLLLGRGKVRRSKSGRWPVGAEKEWKSKTLRHPRRFGKLFSVRLFKPDERIVKCEAIWLLIFINFSVNSCIFGAIYTYAYSLKRRGIKSPYIGKFVLSNVSKNVLLSTFNAKTCLQKTLPPKLNSTSMKLQLWKICFLNPMKQSINSSFNFFNKSPKYDARGQSN